MENLLLLPSLNNTAMKFRIPLASLFIALSLCVLALPQQKTGSKPGAVPTAKPKSKKPEAKLNTAYRAQLTNIEFIWIEPGSFTMGAEKGEAGEAPAHKVTLSKGFFLGKFEITQKQWQLVMGYNPSEFRGDNLPVESVSWDRVQVFLQRLNALDRRYRYRLPTEAEWEFAARAGTEVDDLAQLNEMAWHAGNTDDERTHPVGSKKTNAWGLFDMHGNVWEWTADWLDWHAYEKLNITDLNIGALDPLGPPAGDHKVYRGGSWDQFPRACRSSHRYGDQTGHNDSALGFRVAADKR